MEVLKKTGLGRKKSGWLVNLFVFSFVILLGAAVYVSYEIFFVREEVSVTIVGPEGVELGERSDFAIFVRNIGRVGIATLELNITYPEHSVPLEPTGEPKEALREKITVEKVSPGEEIKHNISVRFLGRTGREVPISVLVIYRPENIQSRLTKKASFVPKITKTPFVIVSSSPEEVSQDQPLEVNFRILSEAKSTVENLAFRVDYPLGFKFISASPAPSFEDNIWLLGAIAEGEEKSITVRGTLKGQPQEAKSFNAVIGRFLPVTKEWLVFLEEAKGPKIASPFLYVRQDMNQRREGIVMPGENLRFTIFYKNNLTKKISDAFITTRLSEDVLNLTTLRADEGTYNPSSHEIRWTGATFPELKELNPGEEGSVIFSVNLRSSPPLRGFSDKNFVLTARTSIDTRSAPEEFRGVKLRYEDQIEFKISTNLTLNTRVTYFDSPAENRGPIPPKVRQETTYTIFWQLANQSNDAVNVTVKGGLPANVKWLGAVGDIPGSVIFNSAASEVVWSIPRLAAGTGVLKPQSTLVFQVALTPGEDQIGASPVLVTNILGEGIDDFTKEQLLVKAENITIQLSTDRERNFEQWKVVK